METINPVHAHGYPLLHTNSKYADFPTLSQYDAYIGNIQTEIPCNGSCACNAASCPYTVPVRPQPQPHQQPQPVVPQRTQSPPYLSISSHVQHTTPTVIPTARAPTAADPYTAYTARVYPHSYPKITHSYPQSPVIIQTQNVPHVSDASRIARKFPEASYTYTGRQTQVTPAATASYSPYHHPQYHYASATSPVYAYNVNTAANKYYTSSAVAPPAPTYPQSQPSSNNNRRSPNYSPYHHPSASAPPPTTVQTGNVVSAATNGANTVPRGRSPVMDQKTSTPPRIARYYANKTMNHRRQHSQGERKEARRSARQASANINAQARSTGKSNLSNSNPNEIVCSFHMDFIPKLDDLRAYLSAFGVVANPIEITWDCVYGGGPNIDGPIKGVPTAKIAFDLVSSAQSVCDKSCTHVIPSGIKFRAYRSMQHYVKSYHCIKRKKRKSNSSKKKRKK
eukprot:64090_1